MSEDKSKKERPVGVTKHRPTEPETLKPGRRTLWNPQTGRWEPVRVVSKHLKRKPTPDPEATS